ncbi:MAG: ornithine carbamoyltransferase [Deltaproteobacteria bacterium]|nr:ornithine carbamoyltransferase [Deltaproteobacteria bacterium]
MEHLLSLGDLTRGELRDLLSTADHLRLHRFAARSACKGKAIALLGLQPAFRVRLAFEVAMAELGGRAMTYGAADLEPAWRNTPSDLARLLSCSTDAIVVCGPDPIAHILAAHASIPVIVGRSERGSPVDGLAVLITVRHHLGPLEGCRVAYVGDGNHTAHSLLVAGALAGMTVAVSHPRGFAPDPEVVTRARELAAGTGGAILVTEDPGLAVADAQVVVADSWGGDEEEDPGRWHRFEGHRIDGTLLEQAAPGVLLLHCLPVRRSVEVGESVLDERWPDLSDLAENRIHAAKALLVRQLCR